MKSKSMLGRRVFLLLFLFLIASFSVNAYSEESILDKIFNGEAFFNNMITGFGIVNSVGFDGSSGFQAPANDYYPEIGSFSQNTPMEDCNDGIDNDGDGKTDCADYDSCDDQPYCGVESGNFCVDNFDNDGDGKIDCQDTPCKYDPICQGKTTENVCNDNIDNDWDGYMDCSDTDCKSSSICEGSNTDDEGNEGYYNDNNEGFGQGWNQDDEFYASSSYEQDCTNKLDDDFDGLTDCADKDCTNDNNCKKAKIEDCDNDFDDDFDGAVDCDDTECAAYPICYGIEYCNNNVDDDGDGKVDCGDPDCFSHQLCGTSNLQPFPSSRKMSVEEITDVNQMLAEINNKLVIMSNKLKALEKIVDDTPLSLQEEKKLKIGFEKIAGRTHRLSEEVGGGNVDTKTLKKIIGSVKLDMEIEKNRLIDMYDSANKEKWIAAEESRKS